MVAFLFPFLSRHLLKVEVLKSTSVGVVGTSIICQGTWEEAYPPEPWVTGRKTKLLQAAELARA